MVVHARMHLCRKLPGLFALVLLLALILLPGSESRGQDVLATPTEQEPPTLTVPPPETATPLPTDTLSPPTATETPAETSSPTPSPTETSTELPSETPTVTDTLLPAVTELPTIPSSSPTTAPSPAATIVPARPVTLLNETGEVETNAWHFEGTWNRSNLEAAHTGSWVFSDSPAAPYAANQVTAMSLVQPLHLPPNARVQLQYWQRLDLGTGASAQVQVSTDNVNWTTVASENAVRKLAWTVRTVYLNTYAEQSIWLRFVLSTDNDPTTVADGWWLDDISVVAEPLPVIPVSSLSAAESDNPALWLTEGSWQATIAPVYSGNSAWIAFPQAETATALALNLDVSLAAFSQPELHFAHILDLADSNDNAQVQLSTDGGQTWITLTTYTAAHNTGAWAEQAVSLSPYLGQIVRMRFLLVTDGDGMQGTGWIVDAIALQNAPALPPTASVTFTVTPEATITATQELVAGWTTYQDTDPLLIYTGGTWQPFEVAAAVGGTLTGSANPGATLTAHFDGTGIRVIYSKGPEGQGFTAQVDGSAPQTVDNHATGYSHNHVLAYEGVVAGPHTLTVTNGAGAIWIEAVEVQGKLLQATTATHSAGGMTLSGPSGKDGLQPLSIIVTEPLDYVQDFEGGAPGSGQASAPYTFSGTPDALIGTPADSPALQSTGAVTRWTGPGPQPLVIQVDLALGDPAQTYRVVDFGAEVRWDININSSGTVYPHGLKVELKSPSGAVLSYSECYYNPITQVFLGCTQQFTVTEGVSQVTFRHFTNGSVSTDVNYHIALDNLVVYTERDIEVTETPTPTPTETPTPTPTSCTATVDESLGSVSSDMTIYAGPGEAYTATGTLTDGQTITLLAMEPGTPNWYQIQGFDLADPDRFGWVKETVLVIDESTACQNLTLCSLTQESVTMAMEDSIPAGDSSANVCQIVPLVDIAQEISGVCDGTRSNPIELENNAIYTLTSVDNDLYGSNGLPAISGGCNVVINGNQSTIERDPSAPDFRIFMVDGSDGLGASLTLNDITIRNGVATQTGGGGILVVSGSATISNSKIEQNQGNPTGYNGTQVLGGGIYVYEGTLEIQSSEISANEITNSNVVEGADGGGIGTIDSNVVITNSTIADNMAGRHGGGISIQGVSDDVEVNSSQILRNVAGEKGGGVFSVGDPNFTNRSSTVILNCNIADNTAQSGSAISAVLNTPRRQPEVWNSCITGTGLLVEGNDAPELLHARDNWWGDITGPQTIGAINDFVDIGDNDRDFKHQVPLTCPPALNYKILMGDDGNGRPWSSAEETEVVNGVTRAGRAFDQLLRNNPSLTIWDMRSLSPEQVFNRVFVNGDSPDYIYLFRANDSDGVVTVTYLEPAGAILDVEVEYFSNAVVCRTIQGNNDPNPLFTRPRTIICNGPASVTEFTIVHELGHVFDNRSSRALFAAVDKTRQDCVEPLTGTVTGNCIYDIAAPQPRVVMGTTTNGWARGGRGWGTGPSSLVTDFQQHPPDLFPAEDLATKVDEAAADMFLNWIYRKIDPNRPATYYSAPLPGTWLGFRNASWIVDSDNPDYNSTCITQVTGCNDGTYPGDARDEWMESKIPTIFTTQNW